MKFLTIFIVSILGVFSLSQAAEKKFSAHIDCYKSLAKNYSKPSYSSSFSLEGEKDLVIPIYKKVDGVTKSIDYFLHVDEEGIYKYSYPGDRYIDDGDFYFFKPNHYKSALNKSKNNGADAVLFNLYRDPMEAGILVPQLRREKLKGKTNLKKETVKLVYKGDYVVEDSIKELNRLLESKLESILTHIDGTFIGKKGIGRKVFSSVGLAKSEDEIDSLVDELKRLCLPVGNSKIKNLLESFSKGSVGKSTGGKSGAISK